MIKLLKKLCIAVLLLSPIASFAVDVQFKVLPSINVPLDLPLSPAFGVTAQFDFAPITVRQRDNVLFSIEASYSQLTTRGITPFHCFDIGFGAGYDYRIIDRLSLTGEIAGGVWTIPESDPNNLPSATGYFIGGKLSANYYVLPYITAGLFVGYKYFGSDKPFMNQFQAGIALRANLTKSISSRADIKQIDSEISPLFPVFYSYYDENKFGTITFVNNEKNKITNVEVSIFIEEFMTNETIISRFDVIQMNEEFSVDLTAFLDESILNTITGHTTNARVNITYRNLGIKTTYTENLELITLSRNNMSWEDDARAATFVSGKDASASRFARFIQILMKDNLNNRESVNIQYARAVFAALKAYGINYVIDPSSAFADNVGSANIDFLQFPYQTLLYHGGDCDDLTILNCSLLEAMGIETAFITVPGHIFMAFDSGYSVSEVSKITDGIYIIYNNKVWIPVEITLCQDTFQYAKTTGMREWTRSGKEAAFILVHEAWKIYNPVSISDSDVQFELPSTTEVLNNLR